jgi:hypothetical protein
MKNFTSYSYFINRILEQYGMPELMEKLALKEPNTAQAMKNAEDLWQKYQNEINHNNI